MRALAALVLLAACGPARDDDRGGRADGGLLRELGDPCKTPQNDRAPFVDPEGLVEQPDGHTCIDLDCAGDVRVETTVCPDGLGYSLGLGPQVVHVRFINAGDHWTVGAELVGAPPLRLVQVLIKGLGPPGTPPDGTDYLDVTLHTEDGAIDAFFRATW